MIGDRIDPVAWILGLVCLGVFVGILVTSPLRWALAALIVVLAIGFFIHEVLPDDTPKDDPGDRW